LGVQGFQVQFLKTSKIAAPAISAGVGVSIPRINKEKINPAPAGVRCRAVVTGV
jgi:hypothetical protein